MHINRATLMGNVGQDPEIRSMVDGRRVANFSLATTEKWTDKQTGEKKERTEWHRITVWNDGLIGVIEKYVKKGSPLYIEGQIQYREYQKEGDRPDDKRWATNIVLNGFQAVLQLLNKAPSNRPPDPDAPTRDYARPPENGAGGGRGRQLPPEHDDEIPF